MRRTGELLLEFWGRSPSSSATVVGRVRAGSRACPAPGEARAGRCRTPSAACEAKTSRCARSLERWAFRSPACGAHWPEARVGRRRTDPASPVRFGEFNLQVVSSGRRRREATVGPTAWRRASTTGRIADREGTAEIPQDQGEDHLRLRTARTHSLRSIQSNVRFPKRRILEWSEGQSY